MMKRKNAKRWMALLLLPALLAGRPAMAQDGDASLESLTETTASELPGQTEADMAEETRTHLTVGVTTPMDGKFFTGMWGRRTSDIDMRILLHGYNLIQWDGDLGFFDRDPDVVSELTVLENQEGDRSYILSLENDLRYSDGTKITAWDYAFSLLFQISPEVAELEGIPADLRYLLGCDAYLEETARRKENREEREAALAEAEAEGATEEELKILRKELEPEDPATNPLPGVRVPADDILMITVRHEYLPFFYELGLLDCQPYPASVLAPGVEVRDDGQGVYLANIVADADEDEIRDEPLYTSELLEETIFEPETGYMNHPSVVSGPYRMVSWDGETAELERNEYYKDYAYYLRIIEQLRRESEEETAPEESTEEESTEEESAETDKEAVLDLTAPFIEKLTVRYVDDNTAVDLVDRHEIDLVNKVTRADTIQQGILLVGDRERYGEFGMSNYPRNGLSYVSFCCEREEMTQAVRRAMALCMDRDAVVQDYTGGFGLRVDGFYGVAQWMLGLINGTTPYPVDPPEDENDAEAQAAYEEELAAWEALNLDGLNAYSLNVKAAAELLDADGWHVNEETGIREKWIPLTEEEVESIEAEEAAAAQSGEESSAAEESAEAAADNTAAEESAGAEDSLEAATEEESEAAKPAEAYGELPLETLETAEDEEGRKYRVLKLDFVLAYPRGNAIAETMELNWLPWLEEAGIRLTLLPVEYDEMLRLYYDWDDRSIYGVDMYYMASNFDVLFDPLVYFQMTEEEPAEEIPAAEEGIAEEEPRRATWSYTNFEDRELYELALDMRRTEPKKVLEYVQKWILFQERFNAQLPILPLYSNVYFDFYTSDLHGYRVSENVTWSSGVTEARIYREETEPETTAPETEESGEETESFEEEELIELEDF